MNEKIFHKLSYGLYVVGSTKEGRFNGQIANTVFQISSDPLTVGICLNKKNLTNEFVKAGKVFSISVLSKLVPLSFVGHFGFKSGRDIDKYQNISFKQGATGAPVLLEQTLGYLEAEVINAMEVETHTLFVGKVKAAEVLSDEEPMTYAFYHQLKQGLKSPAGQDSINGKVAINGKSEKYQCSVCGYVYDPALGDPDNGITPGTAFKDIPGDWVCPICGAAKSQFKSI